MVRASLGNVGGWCGKLPGPCSCCQCLAWSTVPMDLFRLGITRSSAHKPEPHQAKQSALDSCPWGPHEGELAL